MIEIDHIQKSPETFDILRFEKTDDELSTLCGRGTSPFAEMRCPRNETWDTENTFGSVHGYTKLL